MACYSSTAKLARFEANVQQLFDTSDRLLGCCSANASNSLLARDVWPMSRHVGSRPSERTGRQRILPSTAAPDNKDAVVSAAVGFAGRKSKRVPSFAICTWSGSNFGPPTSGRSAAYTAVLPSRAVLGGATAGKRRAFHSMNMGVAPNDEIVISRSTTKMSLLLN